MKLAIVGAGGIGSVHARHAVRLGFETRVCDRDTEKATSLAAQNGCKTIDTHDAPEWADGAVICVPTDLHAEVALPFLEAGKVALIEKPLCRTVEETDALQPWKDRIAVGQVVRFFADHRHVHNVIVNGEIGKPAAARLRRSGGKPRNWNGWFADYERSGGTLLDLAIHDFDWIRWTLGDVESVFACSAKANDASLDGDFAVATLRLKTGAVAHVETSWMDTSFRTSIEVSGQGGSVEVDSRVNPTVRIDTPGAVQSFSPGSPTDDPYASQLAEFVKFSKREPSDIATFDDGREALRIALAAVESAKTGQTVRL